MTIRRILTLPPTPSPRPRLLVIPYAMSDYATTFGTLPLDDLLVAME